MIRVLGFVVAIGVFIVFVGALSAAQGEPVRAFLEVGIGSTIAIVAAAVGGALHSHKFKGE